MTKHTQEERDALREEEQRLCGEYWTWLYAERKARNGIEPSPEEKRALPAALALDELRAAHPWYFGS